MKFCYWFKEISSKDIAIAGGKGANLGQMTQLGIPVPNGFVVGSDTYSAFLHKTGLQERIQAQLKSLDVHNNKKLAAASHTIKKMILQAYVPVEIADDIKKYYDHLTKAGIKKVAVRSSATAEDLPEASFAGQQETFLNISGGNSVVKAVQQCWASLFEERAIFYRQEQGFDHFKVRIAVPVQLMVQSEISGIMFTINPVTLNDNEIIIEAGYGLGQPIVSGQITPDQYLVDKSTTQILHISINEQEWQLTQKGEVVIPATRRLQQKLASELVVQLARHGVVLEKAYGTAQDIEWASSGGELYIVQTRPVTAREVRTTKQIALGQKKEVLVSGIPASPGTGCGTVRIIKNKSEIGQVRAGEVLVSSFTNPDFVPAMRKVAAIVTDQGGKTSHAAIVSRELRIPCVVGTQNATQLLTKGQQVTVSGESGEVYAGLLKLISKKVVYHTRKTATTLYINLADPQSANAAAALNPAGIGLLRNEFMLGQIGKHPKKFIEEGKQNLLVNHLVDGLRRICSNFSNKPVVYRASDLKSNEYATLVGGKKFEQHEENPMLGYRGAARYIGDSEVFALELKAIKEIRTKYKLTNLWLMIPFVRSPHELEQIKKMITKAGLKQSDTFKLWMMVETPENVLNLEEYLKLGIDGISIGTNDLTMLTLGVDRDNGRIGYLYNESNKAVIQLMVQAIKTCKKYGVTSSTCGQLASNDMHVVEELVRAGITSLSVNVDALNEVREAVYRVEQSKKK